MAVVLKAELRGVLPARHSHHRKQLSWRYGAKEGVAA
jgi:hypothetical protein